MSCLRGGLSLCRSILSHRNVSYRGAMRCFVNNPLNVVNNGISIASVIMTKMFVTRRKSAPKCGYFPGRSSGNNTQRPTGEALNFSSVTRQIVCPACDAEFKYHFQLITHRCPDRSSHAPPKPANPPFIPSRDCISRGHWRDAQRIPKCPTNAAMFVRLIFQETNSFVQDVDGNVGITVKREMKEHKTTHSE